MNVLSLFDGMSCGQLALKRAKIHYDNYFASEIKKHAIRVTQFNFPNTIQLGDVRNINFKKLPKIDLILCGSPCQDFTRLKVNEERCGLKGEKSSLFYYFIDSLNILGPKWFLFENVKMKKDHENEISNLLGVEPININSNLVSFQNRDRLYWTNIKNVDIPLDKKINFQDYKETNYEEIKKRKVNRTPSRILMYEKQCPNITFRKKINCLTTKQDRRNNSGLIDFEDFCRYLTRGEMELAQNVPIGYTRLVSINQAENLLGDGWTIDVIAHILKNIK